MPNQKVISMLGLARRAGRLSMGHDMAQHALFGHKAKLLLFCSDVSPRLISEFEKTIELHHFKVKVIKTDITIDEIYFGVGYKAGVITVDDENFAKKIISLLEQIGYINYLKFNRRKCQWLLNLKFPM